MMETITRELKDWGVPEEDVRYEAFGPATIKKTQDYGAAISGASACEIVFARSNQTLQWTPAAGTLLEFGQANGIKISCGCRSGSCGTCLTALKEGEIKYVHKPGRRPEAGSCLVCIAEPNGRVVLDA